MDVFKEIFENSAAGPLSKGYQTLVISLFTSIVCILLTMLVILLSYGFEMNIQFGY